MIEKHNLITLIAFGKCVNFLKMGQWDLSTWKHVESPLNWRSFDTAETCLKVIGRIQKRYGKAYREKSI